LLSDRATPDFLRRRGSCRTYDGENRGHPGSAVIGLDVQSTAQQPQAFSHTAKADAGAIRCCECGSLFGSNPLACVFDLNS
jgi:hypothetical protein